MNDSPVKKTDTKLIKSLEFKKFRKEYGLFIVEGDKMVREMLHSEMTVTKVFGVKQWMEQHHTSTHSPAPELILISERELEQLSFLKTPNGVLALVEIPKNAPAVISSQSDFILYLDNIQDPGNMGTIIRIADWFGIKHIVCSPDTVDAFSPKVVQATMGAIARVHVSYQSPEEFFDRTDQASLPVYGTFLDGENIYREKLPDKAVLIMGNESKGISERVSARIKNRIKIPSYPSDVVSSESLNVAVATSIVCAEFRRQATERASIVPNASPGNLSTVSPDSEPLVLKNSSLDLLC